jgi:hypothetical protein
MFSAGGENTMNSQKRVNYDAEKGNPMYMKLILFLSLFSPLLLQGQANAGAVSTLITFDDFSVNANSSAVPQSSANWKYVPNTDYGNDNLDQWISNVTGDVIDRY